MKVTGCMPSGYASTRLPGKPLGDIGGKPMVIRVVEQALQAKSLNEVVVLTDDERIRDAVKNAGYRAAMTSEQCASGTERIAEYMKIDPSTDIFVNMQGDEVLLDPKHIDALVGDFIGRDDAEMGTLAHWESRAEVLGDPTTAKVVMGRDNQALYFSRNCIPVLQDGNLPEQALVQIGVYIYTRNALEKLGRLEQAPLESTEKLEQLRALEHGIKITVSIVDHYESFSVDTEQDLAKAQKIFGKC